MKSVFNKKTQPYTLISKNHVVDNANWYIVQCNCEIAQWIRKHSKLDFYEYSSTTTPLFEIHERIYINLGLKF